ncbi:MAG: hypothetical protein IJT12_06365 [Paludibacteraceae bacterium]|nr:hypothetical protein [Paludibacteraceae bacterium]
MRHTGKRDYVAKHRRRLLWHVTRDFFSWAVVIITIVGSLVAFLPDESAEWLKAAVMDRQMTVIVPVILTIALIVEWPRTRAVYKDRQSDIRVIIECCDLLQQTGLKVIHTVDTFDSELERIITPRSLHGAFLQQCRKQGVDIDAQIDDALASLAPAKTDDKLPGRKNRYALGTVCPLEVKGEPYCWVAFTHLQANGTITITQKQYIDCLKTLWRNLSEPRIRREEVNVAVMGNRLVDLPAEFSTEQKIDLMIQTFFAVARTRSCCRTLRICVHPDNVSEIDFDAYPTIIAHLAKRPVI